MPAVQLGDRVPRWGNPLSRALGRSLFALAGWRLEGEFPNLAKCVAVVAPHTSNWDFVVGLATLLALGLRIRFLGKHTLFRGLFGHFMRMTGGIPVDRSAPGDVLERTVELARTADQLVLAIAPEGTRRKVVRWKTGYHRIARGANLEILPVVVDYSRRAVVFLPLFQPTADSAADEAALRALYSPKMALRPEYFWDPARGDGEDQDARP